MEKIEVVGASKPQKQPGDPRRNIYVITGRVQGGKTRFLSQLIPLLSGDGFGIAGFLSRGSFKDGKRYEFTLVNLAGNQQIPLASLEKKEGWEKYRRFYFNPGAFEAGESWIRSGLPHQPDLVVIDEVGPMEQESLGWYDLLDFLDKQPPFMQLRVVREQMLEALTREWKVPPEHVFRIDGSDHRELLMDVFAKLTSARNNQII